MKKVRVFVLFLMILPLLTVGAPKKKLPAKKKARSKAVLKSSKPIPPTQVVEPKPEASALSERPDWQIKGTFGLSRWEGMGFLSGIGVGYVPESKRAWRWGAETSILLVSSGSLSSLLFSAEFLPGSNSFSKEAASLGLVVGPGFLGGGFPEKSTLLVIFGQGAWNERLSEIVQMQLSLRAGRIASEWAVQGAVSLWFLLF